MKCTKTEMFITPLWEVETGYDEKFNIELLKEIQNFYKNTDTNNKDSNIWLAKTPLINQLKELTLSLVRQHTNDYISPEFTQFDYYHTRGWLNCVMPGDIIPLHGHGASKISLTYYLNAPEDCGDLLLVDPRGGVNWEKGNDGVLGTKHNRVKPKTGSVVFFPSYLLHSVDRNRSNEFRISVTTDIMTISKSDVDYLKTIV